MTTHTTLAADVVIIGGGVGGTAAAIAALDAGSTVVLTEETDWLGGQLSSQGVPPDEHPWIEQFGCTATYREYRNRVREYYRRNYPLSAEARATRYLNPGAGAVSPLCHEPKVAASVLDEMLAPWIASARLTLLRNSKPRRVHVDGDSIRSVELQDLHTGATITAEGKFVVDATETSELLPLAGAEYRTGAEAQAETGEDHAAEVGDPDNLQPVTVCFAMDYLEGEDHTIERPELYERFRDLRPTPWGGHPQLGWIAPHHITHELRPEGFEPNPPFSANALPTPRDSEHGTENNLWTFRRILARGNFASGFAASDITLVNWAIQDYLGGNLIGPDADSHLAAARQQSLSLLYWMQTEAPRPDGGAGYPGLRIRPDVMGTPDGLAKTAYHRESRRIRALTTIVEQDVAAAARETLGVRHWRDSVGVGSYRIDLHPSTGGDHYIDIAAWPFEIPLGALIPVRMTNLIAGAKNIGTTHVTNGCYRLHPVEWNIGEAAGRLAAYCVRRGTRPAAVHERDHLLEEYQSELAASGVELRWPTMRSY